jgi:hypothetical protein
VPAVLAGIDVAAKGRRAAVLDRRHDLELNKAQVTGLGGTITGPSSSKDIGDLERGAQAASAAGILAFINNAKCSRGLVTERIVLVATRA